MKSQGVDHRGTCEWCSPSDGQAAVVFYVALVETEKFYHSSGMSLMPILNL